ncbi:MAG: hypothetical protein Q9209_006970 [Squamulea sp. 1 TL-2023]
MASEKDQKIPIESDHNQKIKITVKGLAGRGRVDLEVSPRESILEVKQMVSDAKTLNIPLNRMQLVYDGKKLSDYSGNTHVPVTLNQYYIETDATIHCMEKSLSDLLQEIVELPSTTDVASSHEYWKKRATEDDFDEDLYIVDPEAHFIFLKRLEQDVLERSEYFRQKRNYNVFRSLEVQSNSSDNAFLHDLRLRTWLEEDITRTHILWEAPDDMQALVKIFWHLLTSYSITQGALQSLAQMNNSHFCNNESFSILVERVDQSVLEVKRVSFNLVLNITTGLGAAISATIEQFTESSIVAVVTNLVVKPCQRFLQHLGFSDSSHGTSYSLEQMSTLVRKTILLIDNALVSYVRSHGSGFDLAYFAEEINSLNISDGNDPLGVRCHRTQLACLHKFFDGQRPWTFRIFNKYSHTHQAEGPSDVTLKSILTRMDDFANIWGPVYTVPSKSGLVKYYRVSKGIIARTKTNERAGYPGAVQCHYYFHRSILGRKVLDFWSGGGDLLFSKDDLLLIGGKLRQNYRCTYTFTDFVEDTGADITLLGTRDQAWKTDSRTIAVGLTKYLGITISGTQKLVPQTTRKQHILDKWTINPSRANPGILNQALGVEISHCTGNARRISLRQLFTLGPVLHILGRLIPNWRRTEWGYLFAAALYSPNPEMIFEVWRTRMADRLQIGELVCCVLEILNDTGWIDGENFRSAFFFDNDEQAISIDITLNDWLVALKDTHLTAAYVVTNKICLDCEVPDHSLSTCSNPNAFTVLQTRLATQFLHQRKDIASSTYVLQPHDKHFKQVDVGNGHHIVYKLESTLRSFLVPWRKPCECTEILGRCTQRAEDDTVYLRASKRSFHGRKALIGPLQASTKMDQGLLLGVSDLHEEQEEVANNSASDDLNGEYLSQTTATELPQWGSAFLPSSLPTEDFRSPPENSAHTSTSTATTPNDIPAGPVPEQEQPHNSTKLRQIPAEPMQKQERSLNSMRLRQNHRTFTTKYPLRPSNSQPNIEPRRNRCLWARRLRFWLHP